METTGLKFNVVSNDGDPSSVTAFQRGKIYVATVGHPNFQRILSVFKDGETWDGSIEELFDVGAAIVAKFLRVTERVAISNGTILFDGDPVHTVLADTIVAFHAQGNESFSALAAFMEKIETNPNQHSRQMLYGWLSNHSFGITPEGDIIGYKGVNENRDGKGYLSSSRGEAFVNGVKVVGQIPTNPGTIVEMPRSDVNHDPRQGCSTGLHVGTYDYARGFGRFVLAVKVNPRDVVSVPTDCGEAKMRVCRYTVLQQISGPFQDLLVPQRDVGLMATTAWEPKPMRQVKIKSSTQDRLAAARKRDAEKAAAEPKGPRLTGRAKRLAEKQAATETRAEAKTGAVETVKATLKAAMSKKAPAKKPTGKVESRGARKGKADPKGTPTRAATSTKKSAVAKAPTRKRQQGQPAPVKSATSKVVTPPKVYEDYKLANFMSEGMQTLRWLAKEWEVKGLRSTPTKEELAAALTRAAPRRRANITRGARGYAVTTVKA